MRRALGGTLNKKLVDASSPRKVWQGPTSSGDTGRQRPLFIAYEEAHSYLNKSEGNNYAKDAVERIFKEGRKFGVGAMIISQRPSEITETILAQVGTFIALRLTNSSDQSIVKASAPDNL